VPDWWGGFRGGGVRTNCHLHHTQALDLAGPSFMVPCTLSGAVVCKIHPYTVVSDCLRFLLIILGRNGSGNDYFWLKTDRLKKYFRPKEAQTGLKLDKPKKNVAKTDFFNIVLAETDRLKK
jgi:hypothetical protein